MPCAIPHRDQLSSRGAVYALAAHKEYGFGFVLGESVQNAVIQLLPVQIGAAFAGGVIECAYRAWIPVSARASEETVPRTASSAACAAMHCAVPILPGVTSI